jgi:hypothetical protein
MTKLAAMNSKLKQRVGDARSRLKFDKVEGRNTSACNRTDANTDDPSRLSSLSFDYEGVGNGGGPIIGGNYAS